MNALNTLKEVENGGKQEAKEPKIRKKNNLKFYLFIVSTIIFYLLMIFTK